MEKSKTNNLLTIIALFLFIFFIFNYTPIPDWIYGDRCCEFERTEFNDTLHYATFGKSGNVFRLESDKKKNYYFLNKGRFDKPYRIFGNIAKKGDQIIKNSYSDTVILISGEEKIYFQVIHCCED